MAMVVMIIVLLRVEYDAVEAVYDMFPLMIGVTLSLVFLLMGGAFHSIVAPMRSVGSIMITLAVCYGYAQKHTHTP